MKGTTLAGPTTRHIIVFVEDIDMAEAVSGNGGFPVIAGMEADARLLAEVLTSIGVDSGRLCEGCAPIEAQHTDQDKQKEQRETHPSEALEPLRVRACR